MPSKMLSCILGFTPVEVGKHEQVAEPNYFQVEQPKIFLGTVKYLLEGEIISGWKSLCSCSSISVFGLCKLPFPLTVAPLRDRFFTKSSVVSIILTGFCAFDCGTQTSTSEIH